MNIKWAKIRNKVFNEKLLEIDSLLTESTSKKKLWISDQIKDNNSLRLSLEEYNRLNNLLNSPKEFKNTYVEILNKKEEDLKLEVASELVIENKLLDPVVHWYLDNEGLPPEQFNEALGQFWGDVLKSAGKGAGIGALAGGMGGTFAGAGIGSLIGGAAGGLYGGGKHLLKKIWSWRKNQAEFERTKEQAMDVLKKLKNQASNFELDANFKHMLDSIIEKLGTTKAYKIAQPQIPVQQPPEIQDTSSLSTPQPPEIQDISSLSKDTSLPTPQVNEKPPAPEVKPAEVIPAKTRRGRKRMDSPQVFPPSPVKKKIKVKPGEFKTLKDMVEYYDDHKDHLGVLGLTLTHFNSDWKPGDTIEVDNFPLDKVNEVLKRYEHMHAAENADTLKQYIPMAEAYIERLRQIEDAKMENPVGEVCQSIKNKYLRLFKEQVNL